MPGISGMRYGDEVATTTASGASWRMSCSSTSVFSLTSTSDFSIMAVKWLKICMTSSHPPLLIMAASLMRPPKAPAFSYKVTSCPRSESVHAHSMPAGPPPTTITRFFFATGLAASWRSWPKVGFTRQMRGCVTGSSQLAQRVQRMISSIRPSSTLRANHGSAHSVRPSAMTSASPASSTRSAKFSSMRPAVMTGTSTASLIRRATAVHRPTPRYSSMKGSMNGSGSGYGK